MVRTPSRKPDRPRTKSPSEFLGLPLQGAWTMAHRSCGRRHSSRLTAPPSSRTAPTRLGCRLRCAGRGRRCPDEAQLVDSEGAVLRAYIGTNKASSLFWPGKLHGPSSAAAVLKGAPQTGLVEASLHANESSSHWAMVGVIGKPHIDMCIYIYVYTYTSIHTHITTVSRYSYTHLGCIAET